MYRSSQQVPIECFGVLPVPGERKKFETPGGALSRLISGYYRQWKHSIRWIATAVLESPRLRGKMKNGHA
jgi:hypothetical protein